ncbi:hypothetical protein [Methylobacterium sp. A54F]
MTKKQSVLLHAQPEVRKPNKREREAIAAAWDFAKGRPAAFEYDVPESASGDVLKVASPHSDEAGHEAMRRRAFGTGSRQFASHSGGRIGAVMRQRGASLPTESEMNAGLAAVSGIAPRDEAEGMLAVQMVGTYEVAMEMLTRAKMAHDPGQIERYGTLATKLLRTYTAQIEALAKIRRGGEQKVTVEHVHVYQGGQAIVGQVTTQAASHGGGILGNDTQPHTLAGAAALAFSDGSAVLREDAERQPVPVAGRRREEPMPDARRRKGKRCAEG